MMHGEDNALALPQRHDFGTGLHGRPLLGSLYDVAKREKKPVLIDMWATWCKNCLTMDVTTMKDPQVVAALNGYVKIKFQAEDPDSEPAKSIMRRFDAVGLPTYVILKRKN